MFGVLLVRTRISAVWLVLPLTSNQPEPLALNPVNASCSSVWCLSIAMFTNSLFIEGPIILGLLTGDGLGFRVYRV